MVKDIITGPCDAPARFALICQAPAPAYRKANSALVVECDGQHKSWLSTATRSSHPKWLSRLILCRAARNSNILQTLIAEIVQFAARARVLPAHRKLLPYIIPAQATVGMSCKLQAWSTHDTLRYWSTTLCGMYPFGTDDDVTGSTN
jgi:hypothetical protein